MVINFSKRYGTTVRVSSARTTSSVDTEVVTNSQEEDEGVSDSQDDEDDEVNMFAAPRSRRKSTAKAKQVLPFSPKRTRSRRIPVIDSDPEPSDIDEAETRPIRRSTRSKKGVKVNLDAESHSDDLESEGKTSDSYGSRKAKSKKPKKAVRPKAARPAYGHFRSVADLNNDFSDDESLTIREHRDICEKCHRAPGHKLIEALKKKSKVNGKKKRKTSDDEFEVHDDDQSFTALGGWVRW
jgi:chromodomain-helicase-DNA-binding protein 4